VIFSEGDEPGRLYRAKTWVIPTHQRLDPDQTAVFQRDLGLIDHAQPIVFERPLEALQQDLVGFPGHFSRPDGPSGH